VSDVAFLVGRVLFGGLFLLNGINHFRSRAMMAGYAKFKGVPAAEASIVLSGVWLVVAGLSVILGVRPQVGLLMIAAFLLVVSPKMHDYWAITDQNQRLNDFINFQKNMALLGAALMALAVPIPWPYSIAP